MPFQHPVPKVRHSQRVPDCESCALQLFSDPGGVKIVVQRHELYWIMVERIPILLPKQVSNYCFQVPFVGVLQDKDTIVGEHLSYASEGCRDILDVVEYPDHDDCLEDARREWKMVQICRDESEARIFSPESLGVLQHGHCVVQKDDLAVA